MELIDLANWFMLILTLFLIRHYWLKEKQKEKARVKKFRFDNPELVAYAENKHKKAD